MGPYDSLTKEDMQNLTKWGFNMVRLGVMWPGVETSPGQINATYMKEIANVARKLGEHGVYSIADLHQDLLSRRFCGEGVPEGYVDALLADKTSALAKAKPFPEPSAKLLPTDEKGMPQLEACLKEPLFADFYGAEQVGALFKELYTPGTPLNDGFLRFWDTVSQTFGEADDKSPHILGYELLNEPSGSCLTAGGKGCGQGPGPVFSNDIETEYLAPLYNATAAKIRVHDPSRPVFYEARAYPILFKSAFPELPLGEDHQQALAYHIYCQPEMGTIFEDIECRGAQAFSLSSYLGVLKEHKGLGGFMTEFGAIGPTQPEYDEVDRLMDIADGYLQSWSYWQLKFFHDLTTANSAESLYDGNGNLEETKLKHLCRTYAQAIAGTPLGMSFKFKTGAFKLSYKATISSAPTVIYLNEEMHYPQGYDISISPAECIKQEKTQPNYINLHLLTDGQASQCLGQKVVVSISAKSSVQVDV